MVRAAALRLYEPYAEADPRGRVLRQDLMPAGVGNTPDLPSEYPEAVAELHVKPEVGRVRFNN